MAYLEYLDDAVVKRLVKDVLDIGRAKKIEVEDEFHKNVIDPFAALFDSAVSEVGHEAWKNAEMVRQCQKTLTNHIGTLHQKILGSVTGWQDLGVGSVVDLVCNNKKIIAEVKNKFNTVSGGKLAEQYYALERLIEPKTSQYKGYTAYFVNIIPKKPVRSDIPFEPSDKDKGIRCSRKESIRIIDGASFYALVTGREFALQELYDALPIVIADIFQNDYRISNFSIPDLASFRQYFQAAYQAKDNNLD